MPRRRRPLKGPQGIVFLWWSLGNFRGFGEGDPEKPRREKMLGMILGLEGDVRVILPKAKKIYGVFFGYWGDFPGASPKATLKSPAGNYFLWWLLGNFRGFGEGELEKPRFQGHIAEGEKNIWGVFGSLVGFSGCLAEGDPQKPRR